MLIIALTFVCAIKTRGQTHFFSYFYNIRDAFKIEGMFKVFIFFFGMGAVFGTNQNIRSFQNSLERR